MASTQVSRYTNQVLFFPQRVHKPHQDSLTVRYLETCCGHKSGFHPASSSFLRCSHGQCRPCIPTLWNSTPGPTIVHSRTLWVGPTTRWTKLTKTFRLLVFQYFATFWCMPRAGFNVGFTYFQKNGRSSLRTVGACSPSSLFKFPT